MTEVASNATLANSDSLPHTNTFAEQTPPEDDLEGNGSEIRCICGFDDDDGFTIQCDLCDKWQHGICLKIGVKDIPDVFVCHFCNPRGPVDFKRAQETQRKRREQETRSHKKRSNHTSHRRKEPPGTLINNRGINEQFSDKPSDRKPPSPKDPSSGKARSRQRNNTASNINHALPDTAFSPAHNSPSENSTGAEGDVDSDSEVPSTIYTKEYMPISSNSTLSTDVEMKLKSCISECKLSRDLGAAKNSSILAMQLTRDEFSQISTPQISVRRVSGSGHSSTIGAPQNYLALETPLDEGSFVLEFRGEIGLRDEYIHDTINQYHLIRHPKPFVIFHPELPYYIDARRCGSEGRFVRRSCKPNLSLKTILLDEFDVRFGYFATERLETSAELTIGWEWDSSLPIHQASSLPPNEIAKISTWTEVLIANLGECACRDKASCLLEKFREGISMNNANKPRNNTKANGKRRRPTPIEPSLKPSMENSPEATSLEERTNRRSSSISSHRKSSSRDQTPANPSEVNASSVEKAESAREARKMREAVSLIEKMNSVDSQSNRKRVKRPSVGAGSLVTPMLTKPINEEGRPNVLLSSETASEERDTVSPTEVQCVDNKVYHTSVPGRDKQLSSPFIKGGMRHVATAAYSDASTQTIKDDLPSAYVTGVLTKKKRILATFREQQLQRLSKPSLTVVKEELSPVVPYTGGDDDSVMVDVKHDFASANNQRSENLIIHAVDPNIVKPSPQGHQDSLRQYDHLNGAVNYLKTPFSTSPTSPVPIKSSGLMNGYRSAELHVQMPSTQLFPNAPTTPSLLGTSSASITGILMQSPLVASSSMPLETGLPSIMESLHNDTSQTSSVPTPAKKKMSLSEYGKRRKAEFTEKEKLAAVAITDFPEENLSVSSSRKATAGADSEHVHPVIGDNDVATLDTSETKDVMLMDIDVPATAQIILTEVAMFKDQDMQDA